LTKVDDIITLFFILFGIAAILAGQFGLIADQFDQYLAWCLQLSGILIIITIIKMYKKGA